MAPGLARRPARGEGGARGRGRWLPAADADLARSPTPGHRKQRRAHRAGPGACGGRRRPGWMQEGGRRGGVVGR
jgi:hypothetical protein